MEIDLEELKKQVIESAYRLRKLKGSRLLKFEASYSFREKENIYNAMKNFF